MDIDSLSVQQLQAVRDQLQDEIQRLTTSFTQLRQAGSKYRSSKLALDGFGQGRELLVPLTSALYVPGRLVPASKVMVEIGTGYYVEREVLQAQRFCERKVLMLRENMDKVASLINQRKQSLDVVNITLQRKASPPA